MKIVNGHFELEFHYHDCPECKETYGCNDTRCQSVIPTDIRKIKTNKLCEDCWDLSIGKRTQEKNKNV